MNRSRLFAALIVVALLMVAGLVARQGLLTSRVVEAAERLPTHSESAFPARCAYLYQDFNDLRSSYLDTPDALAARSAEGVAGFRVRAAWEGC